MRESSTSKSSQPYATSDRPRAAELEAVLRDEDATVTRFDDALPETF